MSNSLWPSLYLVAQWCPTVTPWTCSPPGSSVHGSLQARILEWVAISFSRGSSWPRDWTQVSRIAGRRFNLWATREAQYCMNLAAIEEGSLFLAVRHIYKSLWVDWVYFQCTWSWSAYQVVTWHETTGELSCTYAKWIPLSTCRPGVGTKQFKECAIVEKLGRCFVILDLSWISDDS